MPPPAPVPLTSILLPRPRRWQKVLLAALIATSMYLGFVAYGQFVDLQMGENYRPQPWAYVTNVTVNITNVPGTSGDLVAQNLQYSCESAYSFYGQPVRVPAGGHFTCHLVLANHANASVTVDPVTPSSPFTCSTSPCTGEETLAPYNSSSGHWVEDAFLDMLVPSSLPFDWTPYVLCFNVTAS